MKSLPDHVKHYKSTPVFTEASVPPGLLKDHNTKSGVWGLINVSEGRLEYTIENSETCVLTPDTQGVVEPEVSHHIKPLGQVSFHVDFYK